MDLRHYRCRPGRRVLAAETLRADRRGRQRHHHWRASRRPPIRAWQSPTSWPRISPRRARICAMVPTITPTRPRHRGPPGHASPSVSPAEQDSMYGRGRRYALSLRPPPDRHRLDRRSGRPFAGIELPGIEKLLDPGSTARHHRRQGCKEGSKRGPAWAPASSAASFSRPWLRAQGVELTVVEMEDRMLPRMMDDDRRRHDQALVRGPGGRRS